MRLYPKVNFEKHIDKEILLRYTNIRTVQAELRSARTNILVVQTLLTATRECYFYINMLKISRRQISVSKLHDFIEEAGVFFLATEDGKQPKVRPLGAHIEIDDKEYFTVGDFKAVYRQMTDNPLVEIVSLNPKDGKWLRYTGRAVFDDAPEYAEKILEMLPELRNIYNEKTGYKMAIFHLEDAQAVILDMAGNTEKLI